MNLQFDILEKGGPKLKPITSKEDVNSITEINAEKSLPFIGSILKNLRAEVGNSAAVLGFVGLPYTLATYLIEGGGSSEFQQIKKISYQDPSLLHSLLDKLAHNIGLYINYQIESGAQAIQMFDSWAGNLSPHDYDIFALPYQKKVIEVVRKVHPSVPLILYINKCGSLIERMSSLDIDIISLDWTMTIPEAKKRFPTNSKIGFQGNLDPMILFAPDEVIKERTIETIKEGQASGGRHLMNLGHGVDPRTSEEKAKLFVDTVKLYQLY
jgi:uroporphyrinogen decarboxylase